jgi:small acid-soluble spore protein F (minor alpha/beta-type SASP)
MNDSIHVDTIHVTVKEELSRMGRRRGIMSEEMKIELAKELGFYDVVQKEGWGGIRAKDAGNMVKRAVEIAQEQLRNKQ